MLVNNTHNFYSVMLVEKGILLSTIFFQGSQYDCEYFIRALPQSTKNILIQQEKMFTIVSPEGRII